MLAAWVYGMGLPLHKGFCHYTSVPPTRINPAKALEQEDKTL